MKKDLLFIKAFRPIQGIDGEIQNLEDADLSDVSTKEGVYIIASPKTLFVYPKGKSKIIYIGQASDIKKRLKEHQTNLRKAKEDKYDEWWHFDRYNYMRYHDAKVYYYLCKGKQGPKNLESRLIGMFYDKFGSTPVGNGARSFECDANNDRI